MKRRLLSLLLLCGVLFAGCGVPEQDFSADSRRLQIVTTSFAPFDFSRAVAGDCADVTMLLPPGSESHSFEPTARDILAIAHCDVFVYVGGESDTWIEDVLDSLPTEDVTFVRLMELTDKVEEEHTASMTLHGRGHDHEAEEEPEYDEHVWTSPKNAMVITEGIAEALCKADPDRGETYRANADAYLMELRVLDDTFAGIVENAKRTEIVFADRFPLLYFVREYGLSYCAAFPGCAAETEPSAATLAYLIDRVKTEQIPVIFKVELSGDNVARAVSEATGAKVLTFYACHNVSKDDLEQGETYLSLMRKNADALKEALN